MRFSRIFIAIASAEPGRGKLADKFSELSPPKWFACWRFMVRAEPMNERARRFAPILSPRSRRSTVARSEVLCIWGSGTHTPNRDQLPHQPTWTLLLGYLVDQA